LRFFFFGIGHGLPAQHQPPARQLHLPLQRPLPLQPPARPANLRGHLQGYFGQQISKSPLYSDFM